MFPDLKSCPFCGGDAHLYVNDGVRVICPRCGASTRILQDGMTAQGVTGNATKAVIEAWNERTDEKAQQTVVEYCPECSTEIEMRWNVERDGYKAFCPVCGNRLMLCDECKHRNGDFHDDCDYDGATDSCKFNPAEDGE